MFYRFLHSYLWASKCCPVGCKCTQPHAAALNFLASRSQPRHVDMLHLATWLRHLSSFYSGITSKLTRQKLWQPFGSSALRRAWCLFRSFGRSGRFSLGSCEALRLHCHWIWPPLKMWWPCCGFIWDCFALSMNEDVELQIFIIIIMHPSSVPKAWKHSKLISRPFDTWISVFYIGPPREGGAGKRPTLAAIDLNAFAHINICISWSYHTTMDTLSKR